MSPVFPDLVGAKESYWFLIASFYIFCWCKYLDIFSFSFSNCAFWRKTNSVFYYSYETFLHFIRRIAFYSYNICTSFFSISLIRVEWSSNSVFMASRLGLLSGRITPRSPFILSIKYIWTDILPKCNYLINIIVVIKIQLGEVTMRTLRCQLQCQISKNREIWCSRPTTVWPFPVILRRSLSSQRHLEVIESFYV